jgi:hypothetical protein
MKNPKFLCMLALAALVLSAVNPAARGQEKSLKYEVTVTNLTKGMILSPAVVVYHKPGLEPIFALGKSPSPELAAVAEEANLSPLMSLLSADKDAIQVAILSDAGGPILPGKIGSVVLDAGHFFPSGRFSLAGMLVTTNDGFYGLSGADAPSIPASSGPDNAASFLVPAYDAGSEANSESCIYIPGPPCGAHNSHDPAAAEGFVHIHEGIHGIGDLDAAEFDWRNPVAKVTIRLFRD